ncbi:energy transducer TonB [Colwellia echini]|uniref:TonB C-terminal domain-containing protein n=1 Tax=Colwellia echini TaxID=1982103 RepID=A0ABY3MUV2_9GAMM|nr:energy transducer TonB [Colwellia echini]TYK64986.1 hypothetical protein CWS31_012730 [Colwellia echini]
MTHKMNPQLTASLVSLIILSAALLILWIGSNTSITIEPKVLVREVSVMPATPPPPPPSPTQRAVETPLNVQVQGAGPAIQMSLADPKIQMNKPDSLNIPMTEPQFQSLEVDWQAFELNDLDGLPSLLTPLKIKFPKSLERRGIERVLIKLDVVIDEQGKLTLVSIITNPHPELKPGIMRLLRNTRFSPPKKDNKPVRARFIWPIEITS